MAVTPTEALEFARGAAKFRQIRVLAGHSSQRMVERGAQLKDVCEAIKTATTAIPSDDGPNRWRLSGGGTLDGDGLAVVVLIESNTVWLVTTFEKEAKP